MPYCHPGGVHLITWSGPGCVGGGAPRARFAILRSRRAGCACAPPLKLLSKDFPGVSTADGVLVRSTADIRLSEKDRLRHSNRPSLSAQHSGPHVSRALAPRSLGSVFRSELDLVPRAPV